MDGWRCQFTETRTLEAEVWGERGREDRWRVKRMLGDSKESAGWKQDVSGLLVYEC